MGIESAVILAVPAPLDAALPDKAMQQAVDHALKDARKHRIKGQDVTPFLLNRVSELTGKSSMKANIGLLLNNARVAAQVAVELNRLQVE